MKTKNLFPKIKNLYILTIGLVLGISILIWVNAAFSSIMGSIASPADWWVITSSRWNAVHSFVNMWQRDWNNLEAPWNLVIDWTLQVKWWSPTAGKFLKAVDSLWNTIRESISAINWTQWATGAKWDIWNTGPQWATGAKWDIWNTGPQWATGAMWATWFVQDGNLAWDTPYRNWSTWITNSHNIFNNGSNVWIWVSWTISSKLQIWDYSWIWKNTSCTSDSKQWTFIKISWTDPNNGPMPACTIWSSNKYTPNIQLDYTRYVSSVLETTSRQIDWSERLYFKVNNTNIMNMSTYWLELNNPNGSTAEIKVWVNGVSTWKDLLLTAWKTNVKPWWNLVLNWWIGGITGAPIFGNIFLATIWWNVGIWTTIPTAKLTVNWDMKVNWNLNVSQSNITCDNTNRWDIRYDWACFKWCTTQWRQILNDACTAWVCWVAHNTNTYTQPLSTSLCESWSTASAVTNNTTVKRREWTCTKNLQATNCIANKNIDWVCKNTVAYMCNVWMPDNMFCEQIGNHAMIDRECNGYNQWLVDTCFKSQVGSCPPMP